MFNAVGVAYWHRYVYPRDFVYRQRDVTAPLILKASGSELQRPIEADRFRHCFQFVSQLLDLAHRVPISLTDYVRVAEAVSRCTQQEATPLNQKCLIWLSFALLLVCAHAMSQYLIYLYWFFAILASAWFGQHAVVIFITDPKSRRHESVWQWYQRWLNFVGSISGWIALWIVGKKYFDYVFLSASAPTFNAWDVLGCFIAFVGITGHLPFLVVSVTTGVSHVLHTVAELMTKYLLKA